MPEALCPWRPVRWQVVQKFCLDSVALEICESDVGGGSITKSTTSKRKQYSSKVMDRQNHEISENIGKLYHIPNLLIILYYMILYTTNCAAKTLPQSFPKRHFGHPIIASPRFPAPSALPFSRSQNNGKVSRSLVVSVDEVAIHKLELLHLPRQKCEWKYFWIFLKEDFRKPNSHQLGATEAQLQLLWLKARTWNCCSVPLVRLSLAHHFGAACLSWKLFVRSLRDAYFKGITEKREKVCMSWIIKGFDMLLLPSFWNFKWNANLLDVFSSILPGAKPMRIGFNTVRKSRHLNVLDQHLSTWNAPDATTQPTWLKRSKRTGKSQICVNDAMYYNNIIVQYIIPHRLRPSQACFLLFPILPSPLLQR